MDYQESNQELFDAENFEINQSNPQFQEKQVFNLNRSDQEGLDMEIQYGDNHNFYQEEDIYNQNMMHTENLKNHSVLSTSQVTNKSEITNQDLKFSNDDLKNNRNYEKSRQNRKNGSLTKSMKKNVTSHQETNIINQQMLNLLNNFTGVIFEKFKELIHENRNSNFDFNKTNFKYFSMFIQKIQNVPKYAQIFERLVLFMESTNSHPNGILYMLTSLKKIETFTKELQNLEFKNWYKQVVDADLMTVFTKSSNHKIPSIKVLKNILILRQYKKPLLKILIGLRSQKSELLLQKLSEQYRSLPLQTFELRIANLFKQKNNIQKILNGNFKQYINQQIFAEIVKYEDGKRQLDLLQLLPKNIELQLKQTPIFSQKYFEFLQ